MTANDLTGHYYLSPMIYREGNYMLINKLSCALLGTVIFASAVLAQDRVPYRDFSISGKELTAPEKALLDRANSGRVTQEEKAVAEDICAKKCKICFNGVECNFQCAEKNCSKMKD
jgi:hypothetical protein